MEVCSKCAKFGDELPRGDKKKATTHPVVAQRLQKRERSRAFRDVYQNGETGDILAEDYSKRITKARNSKGYTKKELAAKLNEKLSVITKMEQGAFRPDDKLIRKLEKTLKISLREKISSEKPVEKRAYSERLTLGDIMKKR